MIRIGLLASAFFIAVMTAISIYGFVNIPADAMIARHWGLDGEADGFSPRNHILIGMPVLAIVLTILFAAIPVIDPRSHHIAQSRGILLAGWIGSLAFITIIHAAIILQPANIANAQGVSALILYAASLFIVVIGNFTAKSRSNFFLGLRTPWTLSSEHAWSVANRTAGLLLVTTGICTAATAFFIDQTAGYKVLLAGTVSTVLISVIISFFAWKNDPERRGT